MRSFYINTIIKTPAKITAPNETATPVSVSYFIITKIENIKINIAANISNILFFSSTVSCVKNPINITLENNINPINVKSNTSHCVTQSPYISPRTNLRFIFFNFI